MKGLNVFLMENQVKISLWSGYRWG